MSERQMQVSGMKCTGCEKAVVNALSALDAVTSATADHVSGRVTVQVDREIGDEVLADAVRAAGYGVD